MLRDLAKNKFAYTLAAALTMASPLAFNNAAYANDSAPVPTGPTIEQTVPAQEETAKAPDGRAFFLIANKSDAKPSDINKIAQRSSATRMVFVAWGGNQEMKREAYEAAKEVAGDGIPVAMIIGPDLDSNDRNIQFTYYARGSNIYDRVFMIGIDHTNKIRSVVDPTLRKAHTTFFAPFISLLENNNN